MLNENNSYLLTLMWFGTITRSTVSSDCVVEVTVVGTNADGSMTVLFLMVPGVVATDEVVMTLSSPLVA